MQSRFSEHLGHLLRELCNNFHMLLLYLLETMLLYLQSLGELDGLDRHTPIRYRPAICQINGGDISEKSDY